jgi:cytochrome P450
VNADSFQDPNSVFLRYAARIFKNNPWDMFMLFMRFVPGFRYILTGLKINTNKPRETKFLSKLVRQTIKQRRESGQRRNDLIDLMIDCIKEDKTDETRVEDHPEEEEDQYEQDMKLKSDHNAQDGRHKNIKLDEDIVVATAMVFLVAGYDTTGITLSCLAYHLAKQPDIQERLRQEIDEAFEAAGGHMPDYSVIQVGVENKASTSLNNQASSPGNEESHNSS